jgi:hypothetical protein
MPEEENPFKKDLVENEDFYFTPEGYKVFTEKYHLKRGYCCQNGCRHCPYGFNDIKGKNSRSPTGK